MTLTMFAPDLPDIAERGPDRLEQHREAVLDALRHQHDCLRELYLVSEKPLTYAREYAKGSLFNRRGVMAANMRRVRAALRDIEA